eukprot:SAG31_NODE_29272_length_398_cov_0.665552_1_plen_65_part_01
MWVEPAAGRARPLASRRGEEASLVLVDLKYCLASSKSGTNSMISLAACPGEEGGLSLGGRCCDPD